MKTWQDKVKTWQDKVLRGAAWLTGYLQAGYLQVGYLQAGQLASKARPRADVLHGLSRTGVSAVRERAQGRRTIGRAANRVNGHPTTAVQPVSSAVPWSRLRHNPRKGLRFRPGEQSLCGHASPRTAKTI